jgi:hypothetical protein
MVEEEYGSRLVCVRLRCRNFILTEFLLWELGYPARVTSGSSTLRGDWELAFSGIVCVAPLQLGGLRGKKSTPSIGWEVPVRSHRSTSRSWMERECGTVTSGSSPLATVRLCKFCIKKVVSFLYRNNLHGNVRVCKLHLKD